MGKITVNTAFYHTSVLFLYPIITGTGFTVIQRTVTEQTVKFCKPFVTGIEFALFIGKEAPGCTWLQGIYRIRRVIVVPCFRVGIDAG